MNKHQKLMNIILLISIHYFLTSRTVGKTLQRRQSIIQTNDSIYSCGCPAEFIFFSVSCEFHSLFTPKLPPVRETRDLTSRCEFKNTPFKSLFCLGIV